MNFTKYDPVFLIMLSQESDRCDYGKMHALDFSEVNLTNQVGVIISGT